MKDITIENLINKLNADIDYKEYTYNLNEDPSKCDESIKKYISNIGEKVLKSKDIESIKSELEKVLLDEKETYSTSSCIYYNIKNDII